RAQRARIFRSICFPHQNRTPSTSDRLSEPFGKRLFIADMRQAASQATRPRGAGSGRPTYQDLRSSRFWAAAHIEPHPALTALVPDRGLFYTTFRNLCSERSLSGRGLSLKVCGQLVHDTSPTYRSPWLSTASPCGAKNSVGPRPGPSPPSREMRFPVLSTMVTRGPRFGTLRLTGC